MPTTTYINAAVAAEIRAEVGRQEVSHGELSRRTDGALSKSSIGDICRGERPITVDHLKLLADALGVLPAKFLPQT